jgi:NADH:ubiquinone oxidoreductase subunit 6 (subunit J)
MNAKAILSILLPLFSAAAIAIYAGGVGVLFMALYGSLNGPVFHETHGNPGGEWLVVGTGVAITVLVPLIAFFLTRSEND